MDDQELLQMDDEDLIRFITGTYDLSPKLEDKIARIATSNIREFYIGGFDSIYGYIAHLVERFRIPYGERVALRLDSRISPDTETRFDHFFGSDDPDLSSLFEEQGDSLDKKPRVAVDVALSILRGQLDEIDLALLGQLIRQTSNQGDLLLDTPMEEIAAKAPQIQQRVEELAHRYERDGRVVIPRRPIVTVDFNPLEIGFGRRTYNGNPLAVYMQYPPIIKRMGRREFAHFDRGLYQSLLTHDQLDDAIPEKKGVTYRGYESHLAYFRAHPKKYAGMGRGKLADFDRGLYQALGRKNQLDEAIPEADSIRVAGGKKGGKVGKLSQTQIDEIVAAYPTHGGIVREAARHLPYSYPTIVKYWRAADLPIGVRQKKEEVPTSV